MISRKSYCIFGHEFIRLEIYKFYILYFDIKCSFDVSEDTYYRYSVGDWFDSQNPWKSEAVGMKKYEFAEEIKEWEGHVLHRIRAVRSFGDVQKGDLGGYIECEENLSHEGNAWVSDNACVLGNVIVSDNAIVMGNTLVCDNAEVSGNAVVLGDACVSGDAWVSGDVWVSGNAVVSGNAHVLGNAKVSGNAHVLGNAKVSGDAWVSGNAVVQGNAIISKQSDVLVIGPCGSRNNFTTFFRDKDKEISVSCGCFSGKIEEFEKKVNETYGDLKYGREYKAAIELAKIHIMERNEK